MKQLSVDKPANHVYCFVRDRDSLRWVEGRGTVITVATSRILRRSMIWAGASLLFHFAPAFAAQQSQSSPPAHPSQTSGPLAEARSSLSRGNADDAIRILSRYIETHSKDSAARILLGQAYASVGQTDRAEEQFQAVLQDAPDDSIALAALGEIYAGKGDLEKAEPILAHAAKAGHGSPQIRMEWAVVLARLHKYKEAESALEGVAPPSGNEQRIGFYRLKASVSLALGNSTEAATEVEKALALNPSDPKLALAAAVVELQAGNWKRAATLAEPLYSNTHDPQVGLIYLEAQVGSRADFHPTLESLRSTQLAAEDQLALRQQLAKVFISHGEFADSIEDLKAASDLDPPRADLQFNLALAQFRANRLDDALATANKCAELGDNAELEDLIGDIQEARGDNLAAAKGYQAAVALAPDEEKYRLSLAVELIRHSNFDAAKVVLKQAEELQPKSWRIQLALGMDQYLAGTDDEATRYLLNAVDLTSEPETALRYLGDLQLERASPPDPAALAKLCEYSDRQPKEGQLQFYCGAVLFRRGFVLADKSHSAEILRRLRAAATLLPKDASPHCQLGKAYRWLGNWQEARGESEICARMDPNSADAHYRLAQIYEHLGQQQQKQKEIKLYEAASTRVADENARRAETLKTFMLTIQNGAADQK